MTHFTRWMKLAAPLLALALGTATPAAAAMRAPMPAIDTGGQPPIVINISPGHSMARIVVPADKSRIVHFDQPFSRVHVGSGDIAEVVPLSNSTIYVLGKKRGSTNLTITSGNNAVVAVVDVIVTYDVDGLRQHLAEMLPTESIEIQPAGDALVLSGHVSSSDHLHTVVAIAERYAPGAVTNLLSLSGSQQVLLEVKFAEVQRSALVNFGLNSLNGAAGNNGIGDTSTNAAGVTTSIVPTATTVASSFGTVGGLLTDSKTYFLRGELNALEQSGMVRTLAEPNVVALSGETATFLAGGEFPIPVVQSLSGGSPTTTIEYKDFGVGLSFTPTVIASDTVNLVLKSEVSALDSTFAVVTNGISVPGLKVRRTATTVELRNGQSFAIAGLIQDDFNDSLKAIPGLGSIPIIGALLRSTNYQRNQTELVVFITVHLVGPGPATNIALPTDRVIPPTAAQAIGLGHNEETRSPPPVPGARSMKTPSEPPVASAGPPAATQNYTPAPSTVNAAPSTPVIVVPEKPAAAAAAPAASAQQGSMNTPPDVAPGATNAQQSSAITVPTAAVASAAPPSASKPMVTAAIDPIPMPKPKPSFAAMSVVTPVVKSAEAGPAPRKVTLGVAKPQRSPANITASKPALPATNEDLPVTAPDSIKAFRAEQAQAAAPQPDSSGTPAP